MTTTELKEHAEAILAYLAGKPIEYRYVTGVEWMTVTAEHPLFYNTDTYRYRPKPEPKTRPWNRPEDVPGPVCWLREGQSHAWLVVGIDNRKLVATTGHQVFFGFLDKHEYSTDRKTWHPCVVAED